MDAADLFLIRAALDREYREAHQKAQDRTRADADRVYYFRKANHARALLALLADEIGAGWEKTA